MKNLPFLSMVINVSNNVFAARLSSHLPLQLPQALTREAAVLLSSSDTQAL